jgi:hypothetical protein
LPARNLSDREEATHNANFKGEDPVGDSLIGLFHVPVVSAAELDD